MKQPQPSVDLAPHEQQLGKYRLVAKLGQGGMGTVYLALASGLGAFKKLLVVKELRHDLPWRESSLSMFMDEAQLAARLDHPNVLQTFEAGEADGRYFLAMEYLDGQPLSAMIDQGLPLELHIHILCEVLQGLQYAHDLTDYDGTRLHVVHRDVSPQNVFVTYHGQVKVVDFGVAKANNGSNVTSPGVFKGKFAYAAPEQLLSRPVDGRCDVFAVGVMLWEAIAGRRFGVPKPTVDAFRVRTNGLEPRIAQVTADVDPLLAEICDHALAIDPLQRIENADAFRTRLQEWLHLQGEHIQTKQLAAYMRERFSEERVERRRVIEHAMVDAGASQSVIATLPRELYDRESGMAAKVDAHVEPSSASGISPSPIAHAHSAEPASRTAAAMPPRAAAPLAQQPQHAEHTHGSSRLTQSPQAPQLAVEPQLLERSARPGFRWGSATVLVCVAALVFVATYQLSRRVTQEPLTPQLRAAHPTRETSTSSALRAPEPSAPQQPAQLHQPSAINVTPLPPMASDSTESQPEAATRREPTHTRRSANSEPPASADMEPSRAARHARATAEDPGRTADDPSAARSVSARAARDLAAATAPDADRAAARERASQRTAASTPGVLPAEVAGPKPRLSVRPATPAQEVAEPAMTTRTRATPDRAERQERAEPAERTERAPAATPKRGASSATRADPGMGSDLRQLRSNGPMRIDVEDPYQ